MAEEDFVSTQYCLPLRSMQDIEYFMQEPPAWRTLCKPFTLHSTKIIKNIDLVNIPAADIRLERTSTFCHYDPDNDNVVRYEETSLPKTLVCHDMANGYHDDCLIDGSDNYDNYMFYNWAGIDIFCYFSHCLLTVPPLGWINVAHAHGVKVIGTLITEWGEGSKFWEQVLASEEQTQALVSYLVTIAKTLKFEGWLLNIENKVSAPAQLVHFVERLHRMLHAEVPHAVLLWYDSVTAAGDLHWQNRLNHLNKPFFDACDGIFTNYSWSAEDVRASVAAAGARRADVFIGIDVWGRNFYGGGMFNTQEAVRLVHEHSASLALFAPAWTHEACSAGHDDADPHAVVHGESLSHYERYRLRDLALWGSLWPFLHTRPPCQLPFYTSFCTGHGLKRRMYGEVLVNSPWYNLRHMQHQPNSIHGPHRYRLMAGVATTTATAATGTATTRGILKLRDSFVVLRSGIRHLATRRHNPGDKEDNTEEAVTDEKVESSGPNMWGKCKNALRSMTNKRRKGAGAEAGGSQMSMEHASVQISLRARGGGAGAGAGAVRLVYKDGERACVSECLEDSFAGGSCLQLVAPPGGGAVRLLHTDFCVTATETLVVCVASKTLPSASAPDQYLVLLLHTQTDSHQDAKRRFELVCGAGAGAEAEAEAEAGRHVVRVRPLEQNGSALRALQLHLLLSQPDFYVPIDNCFGWQVDYFEVGCGGANTRIMSIGAVCGGPAPSAPVLLGHLGLCVRPTTTPLPPPSAPAAAAQHTRATQTTPPTSPAPNRTQEDR